MYMKKMMKFILPGLALFLMVSCDKYEGPDLLQQAPAEMINTSWIYIIKDSVPITTTNEEGEEEVHNVDLTITNYLIFQTATVGDIRTESYSRMHKPLNSDTVADFKYTYDRPNGMLRYHAKDQHGNDREHEVPFKVEGRKLLINWGNGTYDYDRIL